jgi:hypothetical protein
VQDLHLQEIHKLKRCKHCNLPITGSFKQLKDGNYAMIGDCKYGHYHEFVEVEE